MSELGFDGGLTCALQVASLDRAVDWYQDVLGFKLVYRIDEMAWCELKTEVPGVNVGLSQVETVESGGGATLTFGVKDVDTARKKLEEHDVPFDGDTVTIDGMVKLATFFDPDGNTLMFYEDLSDRHG